MSSGSYTRGSNASASHSVKTWSGANDPVNHRSENAYTCRILEQTKSPVIYTYGDGHSAMEWNKANADALSASAGPSLLSSNTDLTALSRLAEQIRGTSSNFGASAVELPETLKLVTSACKSVLGAARSVRRGDLAGAVRQLATAISGSEVQRRAGLRGIKYRSKLPDPSSFEKRAMAYFRQNAARPDGFASIRMVKGKAVVGLKSLTTRDISDAWLSLQYGWKPLISDVYDALEYVRQARMKTPRRLTFVATASQQLSFEATTSATVPYQHKATGFVGVRYKYVLVESRSALDLSGLTDPLPMVWEKIPFSFVFDWFIPVGDFLENQALFGKLQGSYVRTLFLNVSASKSFGTTYSKANAAPNDISSISGGSVYRRCIGVDRTVGTSIPVPRPSFKTLDRVFSLGHLENAAALVRSSIKQ